MQQSCLKLSPNVSATAHEGADGPWKTFALQDVGNDAGGGNAGQWGRGRPFPQVHVAANEADGVVPSVRGSWPNHIT